MIDWLVTGCAALAAVLFGSGQGIFIPILIASFKNALASPYYIIISSAAWFVLIFGILYIGILKKYNYNLVDHSRGEWIIFILTGLFDAFTGICIVYASDATRTPIVMQTVLAGFTVVFTLVISKSLIDSKKHINLANKYVGISLGLLLLSVGLCMIPQINQSKFNLESIFWIGVYLVGTVCRATYNTLQEKYMQTYDSGTSIVNKINILFWTCAFQLIFATLFIWVDFLPMFGYSHPYNFGSKTVQFAKCYFSVDCEYTFWYAMGFVLSYIGSYFAAVQLNSKSASFSMLTTTLIGPSVILFFTLVPTMNPGIKYPLYITIPAALCSVLSIAIWGYWERRVLPKNSYTYSPINSA